MVEYVSLDSANYKLNGSTQDPRNLDYDIFGLMKKRTIVKGELVKVEYFRNFENNEYSDLVVEENRTFVRDSIGIIQSRDILIKWFLEDDTVGCTKEWTKYYNSDEAIQEGIDRRKNMISVAKTTLLRELALIHGVPINQSYAFDLLLSVSTQMKYFEEGYTQPLRDAISASTKPYLTESIKTAVVTELTF
jgi:hypothetical protein